MFNQQQKPAFKFVIRSKIEEESEKTAATQKQESSTQQVINEDRKRKRIDNTAAPIATKKIHSQLERWNRKKEELKNERKEDEELEKARNNFADLTAMACLLCQRKFKSKADLERHQDISELHKKNLNDPIAVNKAKLKLGFAKQETTDKQAEPVVEYRNRAAERRQAYGQPEKPILSPPLLPTRQLPSTTRELETIPKASMNVPISDDNKGAKMLQQMGWKKGEGLGKDGSGILDPIRAESYAQSAGIGASIRQDVSTEGSYRDRTMNLARKRLLFEK